MASKYMISFMSIALETATSQTSLPFATVRKKPVVAKKASSPSSLSEAGRRAPPGRVQPNRSVGRREKRLASARNGKLNPKRRERRRSRKHQHRDAEQAEEEEIPDNRLRPDAGRAGNSDAMMEVTCVCMTSPHERDHADHRENEHRDEYRSNHGVFYTLPASRSTGHGRGKRDRFIFASTDLLPFIV